MRQRIRTMRLSPCGAAVLWRAAPRRVAANAGSRQPVGKSNARQGARFLDPRHGDFQIAVIGKRFILDAVKRRVVKKLPPVSCRKRSNLRCGIIRCRGQLKLGPDIVRAHGAARRAARKSADTKAGSAAYQFLSFR